MAELLDHDRKSQLHADIHASHERLSPSDSALNRCAAEDFKGVTETQIVDMLSYLLSAWASSDGRGGLTEADAQRGSDRALIMCGNSVGLALMHADDVPTIARWNQDLEFTARLGTPGEAHTLEMRQEAYSRNSRMRADSVEFAVVELSTGRLVGFGGLFDISRALVATMFVGIGDASVRRRGYGTEASRLICEYGFFFRSLHSIKVEVHAYNDTARRVYERLGFKPVGRLRGANLLNNRRYDEIIMDLLQSELEPNHVAQFRVLERAG